MGWGDTPSINNVSAARRRAWAAHRWHGLAPADNPVSGLTRIIFNFEPMSGPHTEWGA